MAIVVWCSRPHPGGVAEFVRLRWWLGAQPGDLANLGAIGLVAFDQEPQAKLAIAFADGGRSPASDFRPRLAPLGRCFGSDMKKMREAGQPRRCARCAPTASGAVVARQSVHRYTGATSQSDAVSLATAGERAELAERQLYFRGRGRQRVDGACVPTGSRQLGAGPAISSALGVAPEGRTMKSERGGPSEEGNR